MGILLTGLIVHALFRKYMLKYFRKSTVTENINSQINPAMKNINIIVKGMTCNHCEATVENNISSLDGVDQARADLVSGKVLVSGENVDLDLIKEKVESLGYKYEGPEE